jgi:hypothetical protein
MKVRISAALALLLVVSACSAGSTASVSSGPDTLAVGFTAEPANFDFTRTDGTAIPQALLYNVYEGLVKLDSSGKIVPLLARSWTVSEDRRTYDFQLQPGVTFSNGAPFTADDVKFSIDRVKTDWTISIKSKMDVVDHVEVVDPLHAARVHGARDGDLRGRRGREHLRPRRSHPSAQLGEHALEEPVDGHDDRAAADRRRRRVDAVAADGRRRRLLVQAVADRRRQRQRPPDRVDRAVLGEAEPVGMGLDRQPVRAHRRELPLAVGALGVVVGEADAAGAGDAGRAPHLVEGHAVQGGSVRMSDLVVERREAGEDEAAVATRGPGGDDGAVDAGDREPEIDGLLHGGEPGCAEPDHAHVDGDVAGEWGERRTLAVLPCRRCLHHQRRVRSATRTR